MSSKIPNYNTITDQQFLQVSGPDGLKNQFRYDQQTRSLYARESQVLFPNQHGVTHVGDDPIPEASCDLKGLMSADDKCKLENLTQTRLGIAGFQGAGFPDDGGWLQGDIILGVGSDFISLERFGNVIRFTVDAPIALNCACESCNQIFWVQDESEVSAVRPPVCSGRLPDITGYGELKIYAYPQSTQVGADAAKVLASKGNYPSLIFKRYENGMTANEAQFELVLKRNATNKTTTEVGWAMTPGPTGAAECTWFLGRDDSQNLISFKLERRSEPGILGALLYNGHRITKQMAVVVGYASTVVSTNQYQMKYWNVSAAAPVGSAFTATNVWQYNNPEQPTSGLTPKTLAKDSSVALLPVGTLVDLWEFEVGQVNGVSTYRRYFNRQPAVDLTTAWVSIGAVEFGNTLDARQEVQPSEDVEDTDLVTSVDDLRDFERSIWGLSGPSAPVIEAESVSTEGTESILLNTADVVQIDSDLPGLRVVQDESQTTFFSARPVFLWNRIPHRNSLITLEVGTPAYDAFPPYDILLHAPIDSYEPVFLEVVEKGAIGGLHMIRVKGAHFQDLPKRGTLRILTQNNQYQNSVFQYGHKYLYPTADLDSLVLACSADENEAYRGEVGDVVELLHDDYSAPCVRVEFGIDDNGVISTQFKVGTLDMGELYESDYVGHLDNQVRGLKGGYAVSPIYVQDGAYDGDGSRPTSTPSDFKSYTGGLAADDVEYWNLLEIMQRDDQCWIWWNGLLISPSPTLSAALQTPAQVSTPYFPLDLPAGKSTGKVGLRLWPGAKLRRAEIRTPAKRFSEYQYGQLTVG